MPWKCRRHAAEALAGKQTDTAPDCPKCRTKGNQFVYWQTDELEITDGTLLKEESGFKVYVEKHQGKHIVGSWVGYGGKRGDQFKADKVSQGNLDFLGELWEAVESAVTTSGDTHGYCYLSCSEEVGTKGQTFIVMQWGKIGTAYTFHAYPESYARGGKTYEYL